MEIWNAATIFVLSFLGLVMVVFMIMFVWLAYRYDISFSITTKAKTEEVDGIWSDHSTWQNDQEKDRIARQSEEQEKG